MDKCLSKIYSEDFKKDIVLNLEEQRETISRFLGYKNREIPVIIEKKIQEEINTVYSLIDIDFDYIQWEIRFKIKSISIRRNQKR